MRNTFPLPLSTFGIIVEMGQGHDDVSLDADVKVTFFFTIRVLLYETIYAERGVLKTRAT